MITRQCPGERRLRVTPPSSVIAVDADALPFRYERARIPNPHPQRETKPRSTLTAIKVWFAEVEVGMIYRLNGSYVSAFPTGQTWGVATPNRDGIRQQALSLAFMKNLVANPFSGRWRMGTTVFWGVDPAIWQRAVHGPEHVLEWPVAIHPSGGPLSPGQACVLRDWCECTFGPASRKWDSEGSYFMFEAEADQVLFLLRWQGETIADPCQNRACCVMAMAQPV